MAGRADEYIKTLVKLFDKVGRRTCYPFHVLGSQGLAWSRRAPLSLQEKLKLLTLLLEEVKKGVELHKQNTELRKLEKSINTEYLAVGSGAK